MYADSAPRFLPALPVRAALGVWHSVAAGGATLSDGSTGLSDAPVISVGNLTTGGSGKTPMTLYLAERLSKPAILTRGYRRQSRDNHDFTRPAPKAAWSETGDEAQIFLRSGVAPVGIGANRAEVGRLLQERFDIEHFILDDGFQHWRLDRQVDIVLVDALDPFPTDRLREPMSALARADIFVITRSARTRPGIERELRKRNTLGSDFLFEGTAEVLGGRRNGPAAGLADPSLSSAAAFCGLANPGSFWTSLKSIGIEPAERIAFPDHTRYDRETIARMLNRYGTLLTTEKDWINTGDSASRSACTGLRSGLRWMTRRGF